MGRGIWRQGPALAVAIVALFVALGGSVYAAKQAKLNGKAIRAKSLPGNRLKLRSVPANRLKPGVLKAAQIAGPLTGYDIDEWTLGMVPSAAHAEEADSALSATDAQTALNAVNAVNAQTVNGHSVGCEPGTRLFAGACWQSSPSPAAATAPLAAAACTSQGGTLPEALDLVAFSKQPGINLHEGGEWSGSFVTLSGKNTFAIATVASSGVVESAFYDGTLASETRHYRCVLPLVHPSG
jgi:hypothetical protein